MENSEIITKLESLEKKVDEMAVSVERIRKYLFWTFVITIVVVVVPLIGLLFAIPAFLNNYTGSLDSMSGLL